MPYKVILKKHEEGRILSGHPWVFANEVQKIEGKDKNGSLAEVYSSDNRFIGKGYINHLSKILVRIFIRGDEVDDKAFYCNRILRADQARKSLGFSGCYRVVFAEADDLPALIVDRYGDSLSVQFLSLGIELKREVIIESLIEIFAPKTIVERNDVTVRQKEGLPLKKGIIYGENSPCVVTEENGIKIKIDLINGQKTGYFLDQKDNRYALRRYVKGKIVLDCFCNAGGFSLNAAAGGAKEITAVDISETALLQTEENAKLNGFNNISVKKGDVFEVLREYKKEGRTFDVIILDPPAFAKAAADVSGALKGYKDINILGMKLLNEGGILVSSSCSQHITFPMFSKMLSDAARESKKRIKLLEIKSQCCDHPSLLNADETSYLKFFVLQVG